MNLFLIVYFAFIETGIFNKSYFNIQQKKLFIKIFGSYSHRLNRLKNDDTVRAASWQVHGTLARIMQGFKSSADLYQIEV